MSLKTGLSTGLSYSTAVMGVTRAVFYANGIDRLQKVDGVKNWDAGIDPPSNPPTFNVNINGSLATGTFKFQTVHRRDVHAIIGNGSGASADMSATADPADGIRINIPAGTVQSGVDKVEIYRTLVGGTMYFYDGEKAYTGAATTYDSIKADSALGAAISTDNDTPLTRPFLLAFGNHLHSWGSVTYKAGTVSVTNGSATVTGIGTLWTKGMEWRRFKIDGESGYYIIKTFVSPTQVILTANFIGATASGLAYTISSNPLRTEWSNIDLSANIRPESWPTVNHEEILGGNDKANGLGKTNNQKILFTDLSVWTQTKVGANTYRLEKLLSGVGCGNPRTIRNDNISGDCFWMTKTGQIYRTSGTPGGTFNISEHFVGNILDGTHKGIHRDLRHNLAKLDKAHAIFYPSRNWLMVFFVMGTTAVHPNACLVMDMKINPFGRAGAPSPFMLWTGFTAVSSGLLPDSKGILRPVIGDDLGFIWRLDEGLNDGVPSGTVTGNPTSTTATTLTDTGAAFFVTGDGLKGVRVRTYDGITGALENDEVVQSNTATVLTVTSWTITPTTSSVYDVGGIVFQRYGKNRHDGAPNRVKIPHYLHITADKPEVTRNLNVKWFKDFSNVPEVAAGTDIDLSFEYTHRIGIKARGFHNQLLLENHKTNQPITIYDLNRKIVVGGNK